MKARPVVRPLAPQNVERRVVGIERLDLMLMKPADLETLLALHLARLQGQCAGDHFGEGGFASTVDAEQANAVVDIEPQIEDCAEMALPS